MNYEWLLSSCILILLIILLRGVFRKKIRARVRYALWLAVALRLLFPFSVSQTAVSVLNLLPERTVAEGEGQAGISDILMDSLSTDRKTAEQEPAAAADTVWAGNGLSHSQEKSLASVPATAGGQKDAPLDNAREDTAGSRGVDWRGILFYLWVMGVILGGFLLFSANLEYGLRLRRSRRRISDDRLPEPSRIPVYTAQITGTPCLWGLLQPAVYVTQEVAGEEKAFTFVLSHENVHYLHHDNWWALVRLLCLCLHWYNPLVWLAARLSRQDGELACDESVLEKLGDRERVEYGRTLLKLSTAEMTRSSRWQISTAMGGGGRQLRERLQRIVNTPGRGRAAQVLLAILVVFVLAFTFTGRNRSLEMEAATVENREPWPAENEPEENSSQKNSPPKDNRADAPVPGEQTGEEPAPEMPEPQILQAAQSSVSWKPQENPGMPEINKVDSLENVAFTQEMESAYRQILERESPYPQHSDLRTEDVLAVDLNFDGWNDLCIRGRSGDGVNIPWYCMLWNQQRRRYEYNVTLCNVETEPESRQILSRIGGTGGETFTTWYRFDAEDRLHMTRYVEEKTAGDGTMERLDLTYVEDDESMYTLQAIVDESHLNLTMIEMARQALGELYQWTGEKVDTACFQVSDMGGVIFSVTPEDMAHSRIFCSRYYGVDTDYNLSGYDKSISSLGVVSGRAVWFSPVRWRVFPNQMDAMTDEEVIEWYFERLPMEDADGVKSIRERYQDIWTVEAWSGKWFEVFYDRKLREVSDVTGPYPECPQH